MEQFSFYFIVTLICLIFAAVTIVLGRKWNKRAFLKYIPSILAAAVTLAFIIKMAWFSEGFEGLGYMIMSMLAAIVFLVSIITVIIVEIINWKGRRQ